MALSPQTAYSLSLCRPVLLALVEERRLNIWGPIYCHCIEILELFPIVVDVPCLRSDAFLTFVEVFTLPWLTTALGRPLSVGVLQLLLHQLHVETCFEWSQRSFWSRVLEACAWLCHYWFLHHCHVCKLTSLSEQATLIS